MRDKLRDDSLQRLRPHTMPPPSGVSFSSTGKEVYGWSGQIWKQSPHRSSIWIRHNPYGVVMTPYWAQTQDLTLPLTLTEERMRTEGVSRVKIEDVRMSRKSPDGISIKIVTETGTKSETGELCILESKRMTEVTDHYTVRAKQVPENQYVSIRIP